MSATSLESLLLHPPIKKCLQTMLRTKTVPHAMLFVGPDGEGKEEMALSLSYELLNAPSKSLENHPDLHTYNPEGKIGLHSIETMREFSKEVYLPPFEAPYKVFLLHQAHRMWPTSSNALLKTFEEPPEKTVIILLTDQPDLLLPTIRSRARQVTFPTTQKSIRKYPHTSEILPLMSALRTSPFLLQQTLSTFAKKLEAGKKQSEETVRAHIFPENQQDLSAIQKHAYEKQVEAELTRQTSEAVKELLDDIAGWYRDLNLLLIDRHTPLLYHAAAKDQLEQRLQRGHIPPFPPIQHAIADCLLRIQRSLSLTLSLEHLFHTLLKLEGYQ